ncbi:MAG: hypothetical protein ACI4XA_03175 [Oscillospiraceae bacterium]
METLREIRFDDKDLFLKDNIVKTSILPQGSKDLKRNIKIEANTFFEGSVFGNTIEIDDGGVVFKGAVFANKELHIATTMAGMVRFNKAVASSESIAALVSSGRVIFGSDVNAPSVRLKNCYIGGSVFGSEVYLENCVVLGGVFATKNLTITSCIFGTFNAPSVELSGVNYMLYPAAFSVEPLSFLPQTELYNISMAHLGALFKGEPESENTGKIKMDLEDDHQRTVLVDDDGSTTTVNSYSVSGRVLVADLIDFEKLENHFLIGAGALNSQILKVYSLTKADGEKSEELTVDNISDFFFKIISGVIQIQDISGEISFSDLKKAFE